VADRVSLFSRAPFALLASYSLLPHYIIKVAPPLSPAYLPDPIELDEHVPMYVLGPKYSGYLEPPANDIVTKDQPHADDVVPTALSPGYIANSDPKEDHEEEEKADYANEPEEEDLKEEDLKEEESDDNSASEKEPSKGSDDTESSEEDETTITPPPSRLRGDVTAALLMLPSTTRRSEVPKADMPPRKRLCIATPITGFEVGESLVAAAARPPRDLYGFVDTTKAKASITRRHARTLHDTEHRMMTDVELVNLRVSYEAHTRQRDGLTRNESLEAHNRSLVARIKAIETRMTEMEDLFQDTRDHAVSHMMHTQALEARA
nr:hypothetical protein [Tanacetum cinerariifolium]